MSELPDPLIPVDADLRDFPFTPIFRSRLFGSSFHARANDAQWRAGVTLWLKSWDQVPAGSLPDDDIDLCRLAELGRDLKAWGRVRQGAMRGWIKCSDGRLYHPVVAEGVMEAWESRLKQARRGAAGGRARWRKHRNGIAQACEPDSASMPSTIAQACEPDSASMPSTIAQACEPDSASTANAVPKHCLSNAQAMLSDSKREGKRDVSSLRSDTSDPIGSAPVGARGDPVKALFDAGVGLLTGAGSTEKHARTLLGKWRKDLGDDERLMALLVTAGKAHAIDPVSYLTKAVKAETERIAAPNGRAWL